MLTQKTQHSISMSYMECLFIGDLHMEATIFHIFVMCFKSQTGSRGFRTLLSNKLKLKQTKVKRKKKKLSQHKNP